MTPAEWTNTNYQKSDGRRNAIMEPKAQIAYLNLASRMRPPRPPAEALTALYEAVNRELDKLAGRGSMAAP